MKVAILASALPHQRALCTKIASFCDVVAIVLSRNRVGTRLSRMKHRLRHRLLRRGAGRPFDEAWRAVMRRYSDGYDFAPSAPVTRVHNVNDDAAFDAIRESGADLVAVSGTNLVGRRILEHAASRGGAVNLHTGISPYVKGGPNCTNWCLAEGWFHRIGSTVMWLDPGIDSGPIIASEHTPLEGDEPLADLHFKVLEHAHALYVRAIRATVSGSDVPRIEQATVADGRTFYTREWDRAAMERATVNFRDRWSQQTFHGEEAARLRAGVTTFPLPS